jgi:hypothetical protein
MERTIAMTYYLINSYGGYAKGVEVHKFQAKDDNDAYEKAESYEHPFSVQTLLDKNDARDLFKHLSKLITC